MVAVLNIAKFVVGTMKLTIPKLRDKVWKYCSKYILLRDKDKPCVTCNTHAENYHAGHFIHGKNSPTYFDPRNIHKQCAKCNLYLSGNMIEYTLFMLETYGQDVVDELKQPHKNFIWKREDLEEKLEYYKVKVKELE